MSEPEMMPELLQMILDEGMRMGHMKLHDDGKKECERLALLHAPKTSADKQH